ncbi:MAG: hypothetical protein EOO10_14950 [Chitinophagaceae bacterium]|nr:MAG: hypothetical protein EOO10_14950 [Chitinophagaceae bacterium]
MKTQASINYLRIAAIVLLIIVALNALAARYSFITDPSGNGLGITINYLRPSAPFEDYFIPGIVLLVVNGVLSLMVAALAIAQQKHYPTLIFLQGAILVGWIGVQLTMVTTFHPLHVIIAVIGSFLIISGWQLKGRKIARVCF